MLCPREIYLTADRCSQADPMKPKFEKMTDLVVQSLSGDARKFYEREFSFFNEVTSISRKLQPYIKKEKAEKKVHCPIPARKYFAYSCSTGKDR